MVMTRVGGVTPGGVTGVIGVIGVMGVTGVMGVIGVIGGVMGVTAAGGQLSVAKSLALMMILSPAGHR